jgi:drug/metabolite transporter (DMT)-like permease
VPVVAFVIGIVLLHEVPPASALVGGVIAIAGVATVQFRGRPPVPAHTSAPKPAAGATPS